MPGGRTEERRGVRLVRRYGAGLLSLVIAACLCAAGARALVWPVPERTPGVFRSARPLPETTVRVAAFAMAPDGRFAPLGEGRRVAPDGLAVDYYASRGGVIVPGSVPVLFQAEPQVVWLLAGGAERAAVRSRLRAFAAVAAERGREILRSEAFGREYGPALRLIVHDALAAALAAPEVRQAQAAFLAAAEPVLRCTLSPELRSVVVERLYDAVWHFFRDNTVALLDLLQFSTPEMVPIEDVMAAAIADPRLHDALELTAAELARLPEADALGQAVLVALFDTLVRDERLPDLLRAIGRDPRFQPTFDTLMAALFDFVRPLPRTLAGVGAGAAPNPLATHVIRALARGQASGVLVFMPPEASARLAAEAPGTFLVLDAAAAP